MPSSSAISDGRVSDEVMQDQDRALVRPEPSEPAIQLVAVGDREELVRPGGAIHRQDVELRRPSAFARRLRDADIREQAVDPWVEPVRIAEARKVTPGDHQRVLQGIFGPIDIPEDPVRDREQSVTAKLDEVDECRLVTLPRCLDEVAIHPHHP